MRIATLTLIALLGIAGTFISSVHAESVSKRGKLDAVTVYRGQCL